MDIGKNIKAIREKRGLSQRELDEKLGSTQQAIGQLENNKTSPRIETLDRVAAALNVTITDLIGSDLLSLTEKGRQAKKLPDSVIDSLLSITDAGKEAAESSKESLLILNYRKLNPEGKTEAVKRVEELTQIPKYKLNAVEKE